MSWSRDVDRWLKKRGIDPFQYLKGKASENRVMIAETQRLLGSSPVAHPVSFGVSLYPAVPGHRNRPTSRAAAASVQPRQKALQARVLAVLEQGDATADECARRLGESILSIRPRCSELARLGAVTDSGLRRRNASGKWAIVWRAL